MIFLGSMLMITIETIYFDPVLPDQSCVNVISGYMLWKKGPVKFIALRHSSLCSQQLTEDMVPCLNWGEGYSPTRFQGLSLEASSLPFTLIKLHCTRLSVT